METYCCEWPRPKTNQSSILGWLARFTTAFTRLLKRLKAFGKSETQDSQPCLAVWHVLFASLHQRPFQCFCASASKQHREKRYILYSPGHITSTDPKHFKNTWTLVLLTQCLRGATGRSGNLDDKQRRSRHEDSRETFRNNEKQVPRQPTHPAETQEGRRISATNSTQPQQPRPTLRPLKETAKKWAMKWMQKFV